MLKILGSMVFVYSFISYLDLLEYREYFSEHMTKDEYHMYKYGTTNLLVRYS